jgi:hypothetical protein
LVLALAVTQAGRSTTVRVAFRARLGAILAAPFGESPFIASPYPQPAKAFC